MHHVWGPARPQGSLAGPELPWGKQLPTSLPCFHPPRSRQTSSWLYKFLVADVTNFIKLGGRKQEKFILSQFWRPEAQSQGVSKAMLPLSFQETIFPCLCQLPVASDIPWLVIASLRSLPLSLHGLPLCLISVSLFFLIGFRAHLKSG